MPGCLQVQREGASAGRGLGVSYASCFPLSTPCGSMCCRFSPENTELLTTLGLLYLQVMRTLFILEMLLDLYGLWHPCALLLL